jgi:hypothetical protein
VQNTVVTDPDSPEAVQVPDGANDGSNPGPHVLTEPTPAQVFGDAPVEDAEPPTYAELEAEVADAEAAQAEAEAEVADAQAAQAEAEQKAVDAQAAQAEAEAEVADAEAAKEAAEAAQAEAEAEVAQLEADLEAATKPSE